MDWQSVFSDFADVHLYEDILEDVNASISLPTTTIESLVEFARTNDGLGFLCVLLGSTDVVVAHNYPFIYNS